MGLAVGLNDQCEPLTGRTRSVSVVITCHFLEQEVLKPHARTGLQAVENESSRTFKDEGRCSVNTPVNPHANTPVNELVGLWIE